MEGPALSRRRVLTVLAAVFAAGRPTRSADAAGLSLPVNLPEIRFTFDDHSLDGWTTLNGQWAIEEMAGAATGKRVLVQRATKNDFNVIVAPPGPFTDVDVTVKFYPMSGREDASGGIVFRFHDGKYYVVRANALEDNVRLYTYDRSRRQLASASAKKPPLAQWHVLRIVAMGDRIQAALNGALLLDHRDSRFKSGRVGLWTKADAITAFDDFTIRGVREGGA